MSSPKETQPSQTITAQLSPVSQGNDVLLSWWPRERNHQGNATSQDPMPPQMKTSRFLAKSQGFFESNFRAIFVGPVFPRWSRLQILEKLAASLSL